MDVAIKIEALSKYYRTGFFTKKIKALEGLNLEVKTGEIFGFLGPNGSGKTTTIKILLGLTRPKHGMAWVLNRPPAHIETRERIGYLPEVPYFYEYLTAEEFLNFCAQLHNLGNKTKDSIEKNLALVRLEKARKVQLRHFSRGMLQRIGIAQALISDPEVVLLDEPVGGLDPIGRKEIREVIIGLKKQGKTIFFSSHILSDVEMLCDRVGILIAGRLVTVGALNEIISESIESIEVTIKGLTPDAVSRLQRNSNKTFVAENKVVFSVSNEDEAGFLLEKARELGGTLVSLVPRRRTLEDHFIREVSKNMNHDEITGNH
ncbi:MAG: ABC transporter ATP-binding protein [candidate division WOR-3 bacterium]|nr:ABC transporter ATP-binding protein [candidate division WOR-3 bacterium]